MEVAVGIAVVLFVALVVVTIALQKRRREVSELRTRFGPLIDLENELRELRLNRDDLVTEVTSKRNRWERQYSELTAELETLTSQVETLRDQAELQSFGLYEPVYDYDSSERYKEVLASNRAEQKNLVKEKQAAVCDTEWTVEGSAAKGRTMTNRYLKLQLRAFNGEADAAIAKARFDNVTKLQARIQKAFEQINKFGETQKCRITENYLRLKLAELQLTYEEKRKKQQEKEEQRELREQMREEERAQKEFDRAQKEAEKEEQRFEKALEKARKELEHAKDAKQEELRKKVALLEEQLNNAHEEKARAISRAQLTRSGHVYVISNIGSFGDGVFKIGMTRRLEPMDRVKELGDASVPFRFDVHAMVYSDDAPSLEKFLHARFLEDQVNLVNSRKEFFSVSLEEIEVALKEQFPDVEFIKTAVAEEYRESQALRERAKQAQEHTERAKEEDEVAKAKARLEELRAGWRAEPVA